MTKYIAMMGNMFFKDWVKLHDLSDFIVTKDIDHAALFYEKGYTPTSKYLMSIGFIFIDCPEELADKIFRVEDK